MYTPGPEVPPTSRRRSGRRRRGKPASRRRRGGVDGVVQKIALSVAGEDKGPGLPLFVTRTPILVVRQLSKYTSGFVN
jgi:hypothetical protein